MGDGFAFAGMLAAGTGVEEAAVDGDKGVVVGAVRVGKGRNDEKGGGMGGKGGGMGKGGFKRMEGIVR